MHVSEDNNTLFREDTMFGVCEALGQDFGFNAQYLRIALALLLLWQPVAVFAGYGAAALIVLLSRLVFPNRPHRWLRRKPAGLVAPQIESRASTPLSVRTAEPEKVLVAA